MKKFNPNKNIIITLIIVIIVVTIVSLTAAQRTNKGKTNVIQSLFNDSIGFVDKLLSFPVRAIGESASSINGLANTYHENAKLKSKLDAYGQLALENENYKKEIKALKKELELGETLSGYEAIRANVITRSPDTWQDILVVDKGTANGVEPNMVVMAQKGVVGRVIEVNSHSSKIELLTSKNQSTNHFPVHVLSAEGDSYGLLTGYDKKEQLLVVSQLTGAAEIKEGDIVQTSGLGGKSPANLPIGTVQKVKPDALGLDRKIYVKAYLDTYNIPVVTIIKRTVGENR